MRFKYLYIYLIFSVVSLGACNSEDTADYKGKKEGTSFGNGQDAEAANQFGSGQSNGSVEPTNYPTTEYFGSGILNSYDSNPIQARVMQNVDESQFTNQTLSFTSSDSNVNDEVVKLVGKSSYQRISKSKIFELEKTQGFVYHEFLMYAESSSSATGYGSSSTSFSTPMPFMVIPGDKNRYDRLAQQPASYQINVSGAAGSYTATVNVDLVSATDSNIQVRISANIPQDTDGRLYDQFPLAQSSIYHIDPVTKRIIRVEVRDYFYHSKKKERKDMNLTFILCKFTQNGVPESFPCGG